MRIDHNIKLIDSIVEYVRFNLYNKVKDYNTDVYGRCILIDDIIRKYESPFCKQKLVINKEEIYILYQYKDNKIKQPMSNIDLLALVQMKKERCTQFMHNRMMGLDTLMLKTIHDKMEIK